jgi:hypothetical protein
MSIKGRFFRMVVYAGSGAAAAYFFDPERGPARRAQAREQLEAKLGQAEPSAVPSEPGAARAPAPDQAEAQEAPQTTAAAPDPTLGSAVE